MQSPWEGNWLKRLQNGVANAGYDTLWSYSQAHQSATFDELARSLGDGIAPVQVEWILAREAAERGELDRLARQSFVRELRRQLPQGWGTGENLEFRRTGVVAGVERVLGEHNDPQTDELWARLTSMDIPDDWLPADETDPVVARLFDGLRFEPPKPSGAE